MLFAAFRQNVFSYKIDFSSFVEIERNIPVSFMHTNELHSSGGDHVNATA